MTTRNLRNLSLAFLTVGALAGCGNQSANPIKDYHLNAIDPKLNNGKSALDQYEITSPLNIDVNPDVNNPESTVFIEGAASSRKIKVNVLDADVTQFNLSLVNGPQGLSLEATNQPGIYLLKWQAPIGSVSEKLPSAKFHVDLQASVVKANDPRLLVMSANKSFDIEVVHNTTQPTMSVSGLPEAVAEGGQVHFNVSVNDTSNTPIAPRLVVYPFDNSANLEHYRADGSTFIMREQGQWVKQNGKNKWNYSLVFDVKNRDIPFPLDNHGKPNTNASALDTCFTFLVLNSFGVQSNEHSECVTVKLAAQAPIFTFEGPSTATSTDVVIGSTNTVKFNVATPNQKGNVDVSNLTSGFSAWPGKPKLDCKSATGDASQAACVLTWLPPCSVKPTDKSLKLQAVANLNDRTKATKLNRTLNLVSQPGVCQAPAAAADVKKTVTTKKTDAAGKKATVVKTDKTKTVASNADVPAPNQIVTVKGDAK